MGTEITEAPDGCKTGSWYIVADQPAAEFFPFTVRSEDTGFGWVQKPKGFEAAFSRAKPKALPWYAYDVEVQSATSLRFVAYGMRDGVTGGIGAVIAEFGAVVDESVTADAIEREALSLAQLARQAEMKQAEWKIISAYRDLIVAQVT